MAFYTVVIWLIKLERAKIREKANFRDGRHRYYVGSACDNTVAERPCINFVKWATHILLSVRRRVRGPVEWTHGRGP